MFAEIPANFVFVTASQTISLGVSSEQITLEAQNAAGSPVKGSTVCLQVISSSQHGEFSSNVTNWSSEPVRKLTLTLATNQYRRNFYYKDSTPGSHTLTAKGALKPDGSTCTGWSPDGGNFQWTILQTISVGGGGAGDTATSSSQNQNSPTTTPGTAHSDEALSSGEVFPLESDKTSWPVEPQIISRITGPSVAIAGADVVFRGESVGLDKKPIKNARYLWNFGDGATKEGESVMHAYNFPAEYVVILEASSGNFLGSSRVRVKIVPADIIVGEVTSGFDGKIELLNNSAQELDLSWWRVRSGNQFFTLPKNTKILPAGRLPLSAAVMGFPVVNGDAALLYPNGSLAYQYVHTVSEVAAARLSDSTTESQDVFVVPTPEISSAPTPAPAAEAGISGQAAAVALTVSAYDETGIQNVDVSDDDDNAKSSSSFWLYGTGGVILLGLVFALFPKATTVKGPADEFTILKD